MSPNGDTFTAGQTLAKTRPDKAMIEDENCRMLDMMLNERMTEPYLKPSQTIFLNNGRSAKCGSKNSCGHRPLTSVGHKVHVRGTAMMLNDKVVS